MVVNRVDAIRSLHKGSYDKATEDKIDWKDGHTTTAEEDSAIDAEQTRLQALDDYQAPRKAEYPSIGDQLDMQYHDELNGTTTWKDAVAKVKADNPK